MKKSFITLVLIVMVAVITSSCSINPGSQVMTKWEAEGFELYITEPYKGILVWKREDSSVAYNFEFAGGDDIFLFDRRQQFVNLEDYFDYEFLNQEEVEYQGYIAAIASYTMQSESEFFCTIKDYLISTQQFPMNTLTFRRTATGLTERDIPQIELGESYEHCPVYSLGSKWISDDHMVTIEMEDRFYGSIAPYHRCPVGKITLMDGTASEYNIVFNELDSRAYVGEMKYSGGYGESYNISNASDIWECAFLEGEFTATVILSDYYEVGTVLTFYKQVE